MKKPATDTALGCFELNVFFVYSVCRFQFSAPLIKYNLYVKIYIYMVFSMVFMVCIAGFLSSFLSEMIGL